MSSTAPPRRPDPDRYLPVLILGVLAGAGTSIVLVRQSATLGLLGQCLICGVVSVVVALCAVQYAMRSLVEVWGVLNVGIALGVTLDVILDHAPNVGGRNLWPLEIAMFCVVGVVPCWLALWWGRRIRLRRGSGRSWAE